jgi:WD40 repeat protein
VLSGGWDGHLRLWDATTGASAVGLKASAKAVSACAVSRDGKQWYAGSLDGHLSIWDGMAQHLIKSFLAHTRPVAGILVTTDEQQLITASWDRSVVVWNLAHEREGRTLTGHDDLVAGCCLTPDGRQLLSWSHDKTIRLWDMESFLPQATLTGHMDRVLAASIAPDGCWAISGSIDGLVRVWDLTTQQPVQTLRLPGEVRRCVFLPDGESVLTVDGSGRMLLHRLPDLAPLAELATQLPVLCAEIDPSGSRVALGCGDGQVRFVAIEGLEDKPLVVTATQTSQRTATRMQRFFGKSSLQYAYTCTCPVCQRPFQLPQAQPGQQAPCPHCRRNLRLSSVMRVVPEPVG